MEFQKTIKRVELLAPPDFKPEIQEIEYRIDPLTGSRCLINIKRALRCRQAEAVAGISDEVTRGTAEGCPFCPQRIEDATPRFSLGLCDGGRLIREECTVFPNLFAFGEYHAVATLSHAHFVDVDQFTEKMIADNMTACQEWILAVYRKNGVARWPTYIWNHMPPSGASVVHPHVQTLVLEMPTTMQRTLMDRSKEYHEHTGHSFWEELVDLERQAGQRYIGENDSLALVASYAPRGFREIQFIFNRGSSLIDLDDQQIADFAEALMRALRGYKQMGVGSFNLNFFSGPIGESADSYALHAKLISRPYPRGVYSNDTGPFERLQDEWVIEFLPEDIAGQMSAFF